MNPQRHFSEELNQQVTITPAVLSKDSRGVVSYKYLPENGKTVRASVEPYASQIFHGTALKADKVQYRVVMRYRPWITTRAQVTWQGHTLRQTIAPVDINGRHQWLQLECEEVLSK